MTAGPGEKVAVLNHVGVCVSDAGRSTHFYTEVFGFRHWRTQHVPDQPTATLLQVPPPVGLHAVYLELGGFVLELLAYEDSQAHAPPVRREMNELGLTHLSLSVHDIAATCEEVVRHGGSVVDGAEVHGLAQMVRDPDGQLIELLTMDYANHVATIA